MSGRFRFYRRRRFLPFAAAFALVCINGAALGPSVMRPLDAVAGFDRESEAAAPGLLADGRWRSLQYERGNGPEQETFVDVAIPPIVKNLRRSPTHDAPRAPSGRHAQCPADAQPLHHDFVQQALVANAADLHRLCRLLL